MIKDKIEIDKKLVIVIIVLIIITIILGIVNSSLKNRYTSLKIDDDKEYVILRFNNKGNNSFVPYVNLKSEDAKKVNNEIKSITNDYLYSETRHKNVTYRYNAEGSFVSVVLIFKDYINNENKFSFKTYVFNLNNNGSLMSDDEILNTFNVNYSFINGKMEEQMEEKYRKEIEKKILPSTCDYNTCFLNLRGISNYIDNANYYIENGKLVVYKAYNVYSSYKEEEYYTRNDFKFVIE